MKFIGWIIALCGLWEAGDIAALFVPGFGTIQTFVWNHILVGILLIVAGAWAVLTRDVRTARILHWAAAVLGAWLVMASFLFGGPALHVGLWNDILIGAVICILSIWAALAGLRSAG